MQMKVSSQCDVQSTWMGGIPLEGREGLLTWLARWFPYFLACYSSYYLLAVCPDSIFSAYYFVQFSQSGWEVVCPPYFKDKETDTQRLTQHVLITNTCLINGEA